MAVKDTRHIKHFSDNKIPYLQADEFLEDILSLDSGAGPLSSSGPPSGASSVAGDCALLSDADMHALAKDRQKKDNHNMSE